jgi:Protein of unknown function (DUF3306)
VKEKEKFLSRWSRLKRATASELPAVAPPAAPTVVAELPSLDTLDFYSDFTGFLQPQVEESLKRGALKKLFHSEQFNQMDGLDVYIDDYNKFEPIPEEMLHRMEQARGLLFPGDDEKQGPIAIETNAADAHPCSREESLPSPSGPEVPEEN